MAQQGVQQQQKKFSCSICLDLPKDPVALPCGHSYCMSCMKSYWDKEDETYSCPQCRQSFTPRPALVKNTMLADLVEELKKTGLQAAPADHCYAGPEDVACDFCTGKKLRALKSCVQCLVSFCEKHLQPHYDAATLKKHKLEDVSKKLQENICSRHNEVMQMFCRTDQKCICYLCPVDEHKGHDTVSAAAERSERQRKLEGCRLNIQQRIQDREKDVKLLQQEMDTISGSADKTVEDSEKTLSEVIRLVEKRRSDVKQQVRSRQETLVSPLKELQEKLEQEITELKRKDAELKKLSDTEDHTQFLHSYTPPLPLCEYTKIPSINTRALWFFDDVTAAVSGLGDKIQDALDERTRAEFLKYSREITLDSNTAHKYLSLSEQNRKATRMTYEQSYLSCSTDRFTKEYQVLSRESMAGRCYWEVEWRGSVSVAVAYKNISRDGSSNEHIFGQNSKSWALDCYTSSYYFRDKDVRTPIPGPVSSRVGVFLDHSAGTLSFYSVSDTMTLLHRVQTRFTQPIHAGLGFLHTEGSAELCRLK